MAMACAGFTGGEAEELRRALWHKRSEARMREIEVKLRRGMDRNCIDSKTQDAIVQSISLRSPSMGFQNHTPPALRCSLTPARTIKLSLPGCIHRRDIEQYNRWVFISRSRSIKDAQRHGLKSEADRRHPLRMVMFD
jgi:error-prone DNA polymerase